MRRVALATALGGGLTIVGCALVAGLGETYVPADTDGPADAPRDEAGADAPPRDEAGIDSDAHVTVDGANAKPPDCGVPFTCPAGSDLCDDFSSGTINVALWTRFEPDAGLANTTIDNGSGCPAPSLHETSSFDTSYGVYHDVSAVQKLTIEADVYIDTRDLRPSLEGDLLKITVYDAGSDLRLHIAGDQISILEVDGQGGLHRHPEARAVTSKTWFHVSLELETSARRCALAVDEVPVTDHEPVWLDASLSGTLAAALNARIFPGSVPLEIHVDNVAVETK